MPNQSGWVGHSRVLIPKRQIGNCWRAGFNCGSTSPIRRKHRLFERWAVPAIAASADPVGDLVEQPGLQTTKYHKIQISNQRNCARQLQVQIQDFSRWHCCCTFTGAKVERYNVYSFLNRRHPQCELGPFHPKQLLHFQEYAFRKKKKGQSLMKNNHRLRNHQHDAISMPQDSPDKPDELWEASCRSAKVPALVAVIKECVWRWTRRPRLFSSGKASHAVLLS